MGGAVSSGESNGDLIDNLLEADYIKSPMVERVFRAVDRAFYYTESYKQHAYKDLAWKDGNLHLSAPCIYSEVLENLDLQPGMCFLNVGSGTGYFSTMCGLILGKSGVNHGIELYPDVVKYARIKLHEFQRASPALDEFDFCPPEFTIGNCLDAITSSQRYDRIYCGAAAPNEYVITLVDMLKIGGICVVPVGDSLVQITRIEDKKDERKALLPVSFATLISPKENLPKVAVELPEWAPRKLTELCRSEIRKCMRQNIHYPEPSSLTDENQKKKRKRRQRRRASRLVVVQRRSSGNEMEDDNDNGFVAVAYSVGSNSSDDETNQEHNETNEQNEDNENVACVNTKENCSDDDDIKDETEDVTMGTGLESQTTATHEPSLTADAKSDERNEANNDVTVTSSGENVASTSRSNLVASVSGTCSVFSVSDGRKKKCNDNGHHVNRKVDRRSASAAAAGRPIASTSRPTRSARNYRSGAEGFLGRIRELLRARQSELEPLRSQFQRNGNGNDVDHGSSSSPSTSGREDADSLTSVPVSVNDSGTLESLDTEMSSSSGSSPSATATSTSSDEEVDTNRMKKRSCSETIEEQLFKREHKPDPLLVHPCSVQMRKKILALPLPPALKMYLNYDRKLYYY